MIFGMKPKPRKVHEGLGFPRGRTQKYLSPLPVLVIPFAPTPVPINGAQR
jgi:hypothetical protein